MEICKGSPKSPNLRELLERLAKRGGSIVVIATEEIPCHEAQRAFEQTPLSIYISQSSAVQNSFKRALIHIISCEGQRCKQLIQSLKGQLKDS